MNTTLDSSECSSGCDSGWTLYLEQSFLYPNPSTNERKQNRARCNEDDYYEEDEEEEEEEDEEEDLSMVSDASSGPPHFHEDEYDCLVNGSYLYPPPSMDDADSSALVQKTQKSKQQQQQYKDVKDKHSLLDDTASSPATFNFSKSTYSHTNNYQASMESMLDFSQGYSATHYQVDGSAFQNHFGILQSSPLSGNQLQQNQLFGGDRFWA